jgi:hypothetical protein
VGGDGLLPGKCGALPLRDRGLGDLEEIRIGQQLLVRGEDRRFRRIGFGVELRAQGGELPMSRRQGGGEAAPLRVDSRARLGHLDFRAADLEDRADRQSGRR